jgi:hypothetical protein
MGFIKGKSVFHLPVYYYIIRVKIGHNPRWYVHQAVIVAGV